MGFCSMILPFVVSNFKILYTFLLIYDIIKKNPETEDKIWIYIERVLEGIII